MKLSLDGDAIVAGYQAEASASALARLHECSVWAILACLREAGVEVRSSKTQNERHRGAPRTTAFTFAELIEGLLLGDAYIDPKGLLHLEQSDARLGWVTHVRELLLATGAESKIIPILPRKRIIDGREVRSRPGHVLYTPAYVELQAERRRWYPQGRKIVPPDLKLTPMSLAHWLCGDATSSDQGDIRFCTNGFTEHDTIFLAERLKIDLHVRRGWFPPPDQDSSPYRLQNEMKP